MVGPIQAQATTDLPLVQEKIPPPAAGRFQKKKLSRAKTSGAGRPSMPRFAKGNGRKPDRAAFRRRSAESGGGGHRLPAGNSKENDKGLEPPVATIHRVERRPTRISRRHAWAGACEDRLPAGRRWCRGKGPQPTAQTLAVAFISRHKSLALCGARCRMMVGTGLSLGSVDVCAADRGDIGIEISTSVVRDGASSPWRTAKKPPKWC